MSVSNLYTLTTNRRNKVSLVQATKMSSDIIEPKQLQVQITLAEENLIEQLDGFFNKMSDVINEINGMFNDVFQGRLEVLRTRIIKTLGVDRDLRGVYRSILEYASRVAPALVSSSYYFNILNISLQFLEKVHRLCLHLSLLHTPLQLNEDIVISIQKILDLLIDGINKLRSILKSYIEFPIKVGDALSELLKTAQNLRTYYDESYTNIKKENLNTISITIMDDVNDIVNSFMGIYEALLCLHTMKRS